MGVPCTASEVTFKVPGVVPYRTVNTSFLKSSMVVKDQLMVMVFEVDIAVITSGMRGLFLTYSIGDGKQTNAAANRILTPNLNYDSLCVHTSTAITDFTCIHNIPAAKCDRDTQVGRSTDYSST